MKKYILIIAAALLAAGCKDGPELKPKHGEGISFTTESTILSDGDIVGVSMDSPLSFINVRMTHSGGVFSPGNPLYWPVDMPDSAVRFLAYYPYSSEYNNGGTVVFTASPDQTLAESFRASSLWVALTKASVSDPSVNFDFSPKMSKLVFYVRNESGSPLSDVSFEAYPSVNFNMDNNSVRVCGEKVDIHAHLTATSEDGVAAYEAILAPQNATLTLTLKTASAEFTALLDAKTSFESGKQYSNAKLVVLKENRTRPVSFTVKSSDWGTAPDFIYQEPQDGEASLEEMTDPGVYKIENGKAVSVRTYEIGSDQYSLISGSQSGWRLMNPAIGQMFELTSPTAYSKEGSIIDISVRSFGLEGFEAGYSSTASVLKAEGGLSWLLDENKDYGYIVATE